MSKEYRGTAGDDHIEGKALKFNYIRGYEGNDSLYGGWLSDTIYGGQGEDFIRGAAGPDLLYGGDGNDRVFGQYGNDTIYGDSGNDYLDGGPDKDKIYGGSGNDTILGGPGICSSRDTIVGGPGKDYLGGGNGDDTYMFASGDGTDKIWDDGDNNILLFDANVSKDSFAIFAKNGELDIGYGSSDVIRWMKEGLSPMGFEVPVKLELSSGFYIASQEIESVWTQVRCFAKDHGISLASVNDVYRSPDLMQIISNAWHK